MIVFIDFEPALEREPTGIANVTMGISAEFLKRPDIRTYFFVGHKLLPRSFVADYVFGDARRAELRNGLLCGDVEFGQLYAAVEKYREMTKIGVYTNVKTVRPGFDFEVQIIYDLVYLKFPQFHDAQVVDFYLSHFTTDINSNDINVCISETTRIDLLTYAPHAESASVVIYPGTADLPTSVELSVEVPSQVLPYFLLIGTIEPRKNLRLIAEFLRACPEFSQAAEIVHIGRQGWIENLGSSTPSGLRALGFVDDEDRWRLLHGARALIFPSLYEGFGLPLIEAAQVGTRSISSIGGSLPEVAEPSTTIFFDPTSIDDLNRAMTRALLEPPLSSEARAGLEAYAAQFTWHQFVEQLLREIAGRLSKPRVAWLEM